MAPKKAASVKVANGKSSSSKESKAVEVTSKVLKTAHPSTLEMILAAVTALDDRRGTSLQAIKKYIVGTYCLLPYKVSPLVTKHIKAAVKSGALIQTKGKGASGSFKLPRGKKNSEKTKSDKKPGVIAKSPKSTTSKTKKSSMVDNKEIPNKALTEKKSKNKKNSKSKAAESPKKSEVKKIAKSPISKRKSPKAKKLTKIASAMAKALKPKKFKSPKKAKASSTN